MSQRGALFGSSATRSQNKNLVEFKAGKMTMKGKMVHPDKRKGLVYVYQSEDSLMHFCWKDRITGTVEDDLIIFPDDCEFKRVSQCTTGRVYLLKFKSSNRKFFFWVQEPRADKDEENCRKINEVLNNPPTPGSQRSGGATPDENLQNLLQNMSQQQLMQLFGGVGQIGGLSSLLGTISRPSTSQNTGSRAAAPATGTTTSSSGATAASTATTPKPATATSQPSAPQTKPTPSSEGVGSEAGAGVSGTGAGASGVGETSAAYPEDEEMPQLEGIASKLETYKDKTERALDDRHVLKARYKALRITFRQVLARFNSKKREIEDWVPDGEYCGQMVTTTPDLPDDLSPSESEDEEPDSSSFSELPESASEKEKEKSIREKPMDNEIFYITTIAKNVHLRLKIENLRRKINILMVDYDHMCQDLDLVPPIVDAEVHELFKNMPKSPKTPDGSDTEN